RHQSRSRVHLHRGYKPRNWIIDMSQPFIGEIKMFGGSFAPLGWAFCNGSLLPIAQYDALFSLLGTTYGGDGEVTFQLPDLRGRFPIHQGTSPATGTTFAIGDFGGSEEVTLTVQQMPAHSHSATASSNKSNNGTPTNSVWGKPSTTIEGAAAAPTTMVWH